MPAHGWTSLWSDRNDIKHGGHTLAARQAVHDLQELMRQELALGTTDLALSVHAHVKMKAEDIFKLELVDQKKWCKSVHAARHLPTVSEPAPPDVLRQQALMTAWLATHGVQN